MTEWGKYRCRYPTQQYGTLGYNARLSGENNWNTAFPRQSRLVQVAVNCAVPMPLRAGTRKHATGAQTVTVVVFIADFVVAVVAAAAAFLT